MTGVAASGLSQFQRCRDQFTPVLTSGSTVFCDFDGPIVDVSERYYSTYQLGLADVQATYEAEGITLPVRVLSKTQFWQMKQDRVPDLEIAMRSGLQQAQIDLFLQRVGQIVNQPTLLHKDQLQLGVRWALAMLHAKGIRLVLVTLRCQTQAIQILQSYGLTHLFSSIWGTQDETAAYCNYADQKTRLLMAALAASQQEAASEFSMGAWMIGDTEADILAGQATGVPTIALTCGIRSRTYLEKFTPTCIYSDLLSATRYLIGE
ncbi:MAG: HAD family hydrolase [Leptolyngbyaceae cyanobacterium SM1_4_3]|nr:HAD family hydrolase [Leptolyngbyaceae cyanobacterium SM1_4_3]